MKKYLHIAAGVMALASVTTAQALDVCTGGTGGNGTTVPNANKFVQIGFVPKCSNNVYLQYGEEATYGGVGSASKKGKNSFKGNTVGGGVVANAACSSAAACAQTDAGTALSQALTDASSGMAASAAAGSGSGS